MKKIGICSFFFIAILLIILLPQISALTCPSIMQGQGTEESPCLITTCEDLQSIKDELEAHYALANNINCSATKSGASIWDSRGFEPIGLSSWSVGLPFTGSLEGNYFSIENLYINRTDELEVAIFRAAGTIYCDSDTNCSKIQNLHLKNVEIYGQDSIGALFGYTSGPVTNVSVTGYLECLAEDCSVGGLGYNNGGNPADPLRGLLSNVVSHAHVKGRGGSVGSLLSRVDGPIKDCYATGNITNLPAVSAWSHDSGGLVGNTDGNITNCYTSGHVHSGGNTGGLFGQYGPEAYLASNIFTVSKVEQGSLSHGTIAGRKIGGTITNAFFLSYSGGPTNCVDYDIGPTSCQSISSFSYFQDKNNQPLASWDFDDVWLEQTGYGQLPKLRWELQPPIPQEFPSGESIIPLEKGWNLISFNFTNETSEDKEIQVKKGWNLIGYSAQTPLPLSSLIFTTSQEELSWSEATAQNKVISRLFYLDSSQGYYQVVPDHESNLESGKGYWMHALEQGSLTFPGVKGPLTNHTLGLQDIKVRNSTDEISLLDAQSQGLIEGSFWYREDSQFKEVSFSIFADSYEVEAWRGYFLKSNVDEIALVF